LICEIGSDAPKRGDCAYARNMKSGAPKALLPQCLKVPDNSRKEFERGSRLPNEKKDFDRSIAAFRELSN